MNSDNAQLAGALVGLGATISQAMDEHEDFVPCGHPASVVFGGLASLDATMSEEERREQVDTVTALTNHVSEKRSVPAHDILDVLELGGVKTSLLGELQDVAADVQRKEGSNEHVNAWIYRSLAAIERSGNLEAAARMAEVQSIKAAIARM